MSIDTEDEKKETNDGGTIAPYVSKVLNNTLTTLSKTTRTLQR